MVQRLTTILLHLYKLFLFLVSRVPKHEIDAFAVADRAIFRPDVLERIQAQRVHFRVEPHAVADHHRHELAHFSAAKEAVGLEQRLPLEHLVVGANHGRPRGGQREEHVVEPQFVQLFAAPQDRDRIRKKRANVQDNIGIHFVLRGVFFYSVKNEKNK